MNPNQVQCLASSSGGRLLLVPCTPPDTLWLCLHAILSSIAISYGIPYLLSPDICVSAWYVVQQVLFPTPDMTLFLCREEWLLRTALKYFSALGARQCRQQHYISCLLNKSQAYFLYFFPASLLPLLWAVLLVTQVLAIAFCLAIFCPSLCGRI